MKFNHLILTVLLFLIICCNQDSKKSDILEYPKEKKFVGSKTCVECHQQQFKDWQGSHHDLAMKTANEKTIIGDFNNTTFTHYDITSKFFKRDGKFYVNTEGGDGTFQDFEIKFTFGVDPLQQYLISFPGGRLQSLTIAWDNQKKQWYHLYPDEKITADDWLHWSKGGQNWNGMCAECHSTNLQKGYDETQKSFTTTYSEINVSCESCHGEGNQHVFWAKNQGYLDSNLAHAIGFSHNLSDSTSNVQIENCARCHARRYRLSESFEVKGDFLNNFVPEFINEGLYHPDGQILDEVYVYGSFLQSKMYKMGVRCTDCHDPHTAQLKQTGNQVCTSCHQQQHPAEKYDIPEHHHHQIGSEGAQCINCHMPGKKYMGIDYRRDHSFRIPRPDLSVKIGVPNACTDCHTEKTNIWAAKTIDKWFGKNRPKHFAEAFHWARTRDPRVADSIMGIVADEYYTPIVRATAAWLLRHSAQDSSVQAKLNQELSNKEPLVRLASLRALEEVPVHSRFEKVFSMLSDDIIAIRLEAARNLMSASPTMFSLEQRTIYNDYLKEYESSLTVNLDFPSGQMNKGILKANQGKVHEAIRAYEEALRLDSRFHQARINLANLYHQIGDKYKAEMAFKEVVKNEPGFGPGYYSLGLLLAEDKKFKDAAFYLKKADSLIFDNPRVPYNFGLALQQAGNKKMAERAYYKALAMSPESMDFMNALAILYIQEDQLSKAQEVAVKMLTQDAQSQQGRQLMQYIATKMRRPPPKKK